MLENRINHDVGDEAKERFEHYCEILRMKKHLVLALMIHTFDSLPPSIQDALASNRPGVAEAARKKLSQLDGKTGEATKLVEQAHLAAQKQKKVPRRGA